MGNKTVSFLGMDSSWRYWLRRYPAASPDGTGTQDYPGQAEENPGKSPVQKKCSVDEFGNNVRSIGMVLSHTTPDRGEKYYDRIMWDQKG